MRKQTQDKRKVQWQNIHSVTQSSNFTQSYNHAVMMDECPKCSVECSTGAYSLQSPPLQKTQSLSLRDKVLILRLSQNRRSYEKIDVSIRERPFFLA